MSGGCGYAQLPLSHFLGTVRIYQHLTISVPGFCLQSSLECLSDLDCKADSISERKQDFDSVKP